MSAKSHRATVRSFCQLQSLLKEAGIQPKRRLNPVDIPLHDCEDRASSHRNPAPESADRQLFMQSMVGVNRASWRHARHRCIDQPPAPGINVDEENLRLMKESLQEQSPADILDHPEYIEGWIGSAGKRFLPNLRSGLYSIQGQLDLHGFNRMEARLAVEEYIRRMSRFHSCCIKIIHGRGINSLTDKAALKESLQRFLTTRRMSRYVVAYASAPSRDGGVGAVYVLLKHS